MRINQENPERDKEEESSSPLTRLVPIVLVAVLALALAIAAEKRALAASAQADRLEERVRALEHPVPANPSNPVSAPEPAVPSHGP